MPSPSSNRWKGNVSWQFRNIIYYPETKVLFGNAEGIKLVEEGY